MPERASIDQWSFRSALVMGALAVLVGCKDPAKSIPRLPTRLPGTVAKAEVDPAEGQRYRETAGEAIAPVVVGDDPAPVAAVVANQAGRPGGPGSLNGHPNGITRESLNRSIQGAMGSLAACFTNLTLNPMVAVSFEAEPSGRPSLVRVNGAPPDAERCIRNVVQGIRFPGFEGKGVQVDLPLSFHQVGRPAQAAAAPGEQPGPGQNAPPLFMQP